MMARIYKDILGSLKKQEKLLAVLIDPDKMVLADLPKFVAKMHSSIATHVFVGGSDVDSNATSALVSVLRKHTELPIILFPGDITQITDTADALLFLSLISGRNPDYLIDKHVQAAAILKNSDLEIIPTAYILVENGKETSVQRVTQTQPMKRDNIEKTVDTAVAGQLLGHKLVYLEAGSGASDPVDLEMISAVKEALIIPLIVGGGIRTNEQLQAVYKAGANMVVIGTAFEEDETFFNALT